MQPADRRKARGGYEIDVKDVVDGGQVYRLHNNHFNIRVCHGVFKGRQLVHGYSQGTLEAPKITIEMMDSDRTRRTSGPRPMNQRFIQS